jgi:hypothetical protein
MIDTSLTLGPGPGQQFYAQMAFDGTNYFMVWWDRRGYADIYGSRVSPDGTPLDPGGIPISTVSPWESYPDVAFDGTNYLVVWEDDRFADPAIFGCRVTTTGVVLDDTGFVISAATNNRTLPAVAFDGVNYLVVWQDERNSSFDADIYACRVTPAGSVLDPNGIAVYSGLKDQLAPDVALNGGNCLVVWQDNNPNEYNANIRGARVSPAGTILDPGGFDVVAESISQMQPAIATDGVNWLVVWFDRRDMFEGFDIYCARVSGAGAVLDPGGTRVTPDSAAPGEPAVEFNGTDFLVAWQDARTGTPYVNDIHAARVSAAGQVLDPDGIIVSRQLNNEENAAVGAAGGNWLVAWTDRRNPESDIFAARVSGAGQVLDPDGRLMSRAGDQRFDPGLAWGESQWLAVWVDSRDGAWTNIYGARVATWDTVRDESGFAISAQQWSETYPAVAWGSGAWLVAWVDARSGPSSADIYCARVTGDGQVLDPNGILLCNAANWQMFPDVGFDGTNWLVVWEDQRGGSNHYEIYGARVSPGGAVLDPGGFSISEYPADLGEPAVSFNGADYLVVWNDEHGGSYNKIYGRRVAPDGTFPDTASFNISGSSDQHSPDVAWDGANWLVAWSDGLFHGIKARRVAPGGTLPDSAPLRVSGGGASYDDLPVVAFDGFTWLVAWLSSDGQDEHTDIWGARVAPGGALLDSVLMAGGPEYQGCPVLARDGGFSMLLAYVASAGEYQGRTYNVRRVFGMLRPYPGVEDERPTPGAMRFASGPSIVRGVLEISSQPTANSLRPEIGLLDAGGRQVMKLKPGDNDVSRLAPGVYFVRSEPSAVSRGRSAVTRVILAR